MRVRTAVATLLLGFTTTGCQPAETATDDAAAGDAATVTDPEVARAAVDQVRTEWIAAAERDDAAAVAALYADNAIFIDSDAVAHEGRAAIQTALAAVFPASKGLTVTEKTFDASGDVVYTTGDFSQTITTPDAKTMTAGGKYLVVTRRQPDGTWKIVRHVSVTPPATTL